jgi:hypothetical protein
MLRSTHRRGSSSERVPAVSSYENSLVLAMAAIFLLSWGGQSLNSWRRSNDDAA